MSIVLKLNRLDQAHVRLGDSLLVPTVFRPELEHAPLPVSLSALDSVPYFLAVSKQIQAFGAYRFGTLVYWGPTSTGRAESPTPAGLFFTNWKSRETISTEDGTWVLKWYFNFHSSRGISFHQYDLPGYPASHACVRMLAPDAEWLYGWAEQWRVSEDGQTVLAYGTPVLVFGEYDFGAPQALWRILSKDGTQPRITVEQLEAELAPFLALIRERVADRLRVVGPPQEP
ncbi:MAG: L,D-transpeptidase [Gemmatimonadota bacterium]